MRRETVSHSAGSVVYSSKVFRAENSWCFSAASIHEPGFFSLWPSPAHVSMNVRHVPNREISVQQRCLLSCPPCALKCAAGEPGAPFNNRENAGSRPTCYCPHRCTKKPRTATCLKPHHAKVGRFLAEMSGETLGEVLLPAAKRQRTMQEGAEVAPGPVMGGAGVEGLKQGLSARALEPAGPEQQQLGRQQLIGRTEFLRLVQQSIRSLGFAEVRADASAHLLCRCFARSKGTQPVTAAVHCPPARRRLRHSWRPSRACAARTPLWTRCRQQWWQGIGSALAPAWSGCVVSCRKA